MRTVDDLVTWLRAQLDDDARVARAAGGSHFYDCDPSECVDHHERWDDERVLAEVDAKRRIVDLHDGVKRRVRSGGYETDQYALAALELVIARMALPYADRPGYREDWRP